MRPRVFPERSMVMKTITTTSSSLKRNKEGGWNLNTDLCVDVKTFLRTDRITQLGKDYAGVLTRDAEDHYSFSESTFPSTVERRNVHLYEGDHITCTKRLNGTVRLNFKNLKMGSDFSIDGYALEVANEIREALDGLIENK